MEQTTYETWGTCSKFINFEIDDDHIIHNVHFIGGCSGNTQEYLLSLKEGRLRMSSQCSKASSVAANQHHVQTNLRKLLRKNSTDV